MIGAGLMVVAFFASFFLHEIPLRKTHQRAAVQPDAAGLRTELPAS